MSPYIHHISKLLFVAAIAFNMNAHALTSDRDQPVNISSEEQIANLESNKAIFIRNVVATQGSMELHADKAEVLRDENGELKEIHAYGNQATFKMEQDNGKIVRSRSAVIDYYPQKSLVILTGKAIVWQDDSHVNGEKIEYNLQSRRIKATTNASRGGRVHSTFIPSQLREKNTEKAPAAESEHHQN